MYSLIFERTILPSKAVTVKASMAIENEGTKLIGNLSFPNTTSWGKFIGAIQRGALEIRDLTVEVIPGKPPTNFKPDPSARVVPGKAAEEVKK